MQRVLLVDDDPDIRRIAEVSLQAVARLEVHLAGSGAEALALAIAVQPEVILLDVMMPGMDGPETLKLLQREPETAHIPVVFMTARIQRGEVEQYLAMGVIGVIAKPFDPMTLGDQVRALVGAAK